MATTTETAQYGIRSFDLSTDRAAESDYELIQAPKARIVSTIDVPDECYLHIGSETSPGLDLRDYSVLKMGTGKTFGQLYLENPTGATGTLQLLIGVDVDAELEETIQTVENIGSVVDVDVDQFGGADQSAVDVASKIDELEDALRSVGTDELQAVLFGLDDGNSLQEAGVEQLNTAASVTNHGLLTYLARALGDVAQDELRVSSPNPLDASAATITTNVNQLQNPATIAHGQKVVTTAGTEEAMPTQAIPDGYAATIKAQTSNTGNVYVGDSTVASSTGFILQPGESVSVAPDNLDDVSIDVDTNGEGVSWIVESA